MSFIHILMYFSIDNLQLTDKSGLLLMFVNKVEPCSLIYALSMAIFLTQ